MARKIKPGKNPPPWEMRKQTVRPGGQSRTSRTIISVLFVALFIVGVIIGWRISHNKKTEPATDGTVVTETTEETPVTDVGNYNAVIDIRDYGQITLFLDGSAAPISVRNFVDLANRGFYDGLKFHRIMVGFMIQGGASYTESVPTITGEFSANGIENPISHTRGAISMARSDDYNSANTQFFIVHQDSTFLDGNYAAFGRVTSGMEIVDLICENTPVTDNNGSVAEADRPVIETVTVVD
jgi:peptidyl-prolyl cis-trans isomerase B (cyclophilin B)